MISNLKLIDRFASVIAMAEDTLKIPSFKAVERLIAALCCMTLIGIGYIANTMTKVQEQTSTISTQVARIEEQQKAATQRQDDSNLRNEAQQLQINDHEHRLTILETKVNRSKQYNK